MTMRKQDWFFVQVLIAGGMLSHTLSLTSDEAQQHLNNLQKQEGTRRAYAVEIGIF